VEDRVTRVEAESRAAQKTAAGVPTSVQRHTASPGGYRTANVLARRADHAAHDREHPESVLRRRRRHNVERAANGRRRARHEVDVASGVHAMRHRESRDRIKAYQTSLFAESPEKRIAVPDAHRVVILSDLQIPFEDGPALDQALEVLHRINPDTVVLNGDIADCYAESAFLKDSVKAQESIPQTHERVRTLLDILQDVPNKVWMGGNHEDRWRRLLWSESPTALAMLREHQRAAGLDGIDLKDPVASFEKLFEMPKFGFKYYPYSHRLYFADNNLIVTHGKYVSRHSGYSAKRTWEWLGTSCIVGHTHRLGSYLITQDGHEAGAWENGCLCQLEPEYDDAPNWQQGFSVVHVDGPEFHVVQVPIVRRRGKPVAVYQPVA
jgi:predicted phosphodiesterase